MKLEINPYDYAMTHFVDLVNNGAVYDIKIQPLFKRHHQYYFDGYVIDFDDTGNILFGVYGLAMFKTVYDEWPEIPVTAPALMTTKNPVIAAAVNKAFKIHIGRDDLKDWEVETFLHAGAGANNAKSAIFGAFYRGLEKSKDFEDPEEKRNIVINEVIGAAKIEASWRRTLFDDPRDYEAIELGFEYYDKI